MTTFLTLLLLGYDSYFCDLHAHTDYSDGRGLPREAYVYARDSARIDVLALTDHTHYLNSGTYGQEREIAAELTEPGRFVALAGQEFGSLNAFGHFSIYDADSLCPVSTSDLTRFYQWIASLHEPVQFNHPSLGNFNDFVYNRQADVYATTLEVVNGSGQYTPENEASFVLALQNGWHVAPVANQDNHNRKWGDWSNDQGQIALTGIWADTLTKEAILEGLLERRVYATEVKPADDRIRLTEFSIGSLPMGSTGVLTDSVAEMRVAVQADSSFRQLYLYRNGELFDSAYAPPVSYFNPAWTKNVPVGSSYYFVKGEQTDGDHFWTAPIWLSYRAQPRSLEFYPNPFSANTRIAYAADAAQFRPKLEIFNSAGDRVYYSAPTTQLDAGGYFTWDGRNGSGRVLPNGVYYVRVTLDYFLEKRVTLYMGKVAIER
jgi:hypothetical protein